MSIDKDALDRHITGNNGADQFKISYEEAQDSIEILKLLRSIKNQFNQISNEFDNVLIDDQDRVDASKLADQTQLIIEKAEDILAENNLCMQCAQPLECVILGNSTEKLCRSCG